MSSLLVWARRDNEHAEQWKQFARGDVIDIREEDNWHWGNAIMGPDALGWWRVVIVEGTPAKALHGLVMGDPAPDKPIPYRIRTHRIDIDALEAAEGRKLEHWEALVVSFETIFGAIQQKLVMPDMTVIGLERTVLG